MLILLITVAVFYLIFVHPMIKDARGGYQSKYDTVLDNYIDMELTKRYKYTQVVKQRKID